MKVWGQHNKGQHFVSLNVAVHLAAHTGAVVIVLVVAKLGLKYLLSKECPHLLLEMFSFFLSVKVTLVI